MAVLVFEPYDEPRVEYEPRLVVSPMNVEYQERAIDGLNSNLETWYLNYNKKNGTDVEAVYDFFKSHAGYKAFEWTPPNAVTPKRFVCAVFSKTFDHYMKVQSLTATLKEVPL